MKIYCVDVEKAFLVNMQEADKAFLNLKRSVLIHCRQNSTPIGVAIFRLCS